MSRPPVLGNYRFAALLQTAVIKVVNVTEKFRFVIQENVAPLSTERRRFGIILGPQPQQEGMKPRVWIKLCNVAVTCLIYNILSNFYLSDHLSYKVCGCSPPLTGERYFLDCLLHVQFYCCAHLLKLPVSYAGGWRLI